MHGYRVRYRARVVCEPPFAGTVSEVVRAVAPNAIAKPRVRELRGNADANRKVGAFFLAIRYIGVGANFEAAIYGRILIDHEGHGLGSAWILLQVLSLRLSHGESERSLLHRSNLS